jgi:hypothetical protein
MWGDVKLVYGKPRHGHSGIERANRDVEDMLVDNMNGENQINILTIWINNILI